MINVVGKIIVKEMRCRGHWVESDEDLRVKHWHPYMRMRHYLVGPTLRLEVERSWSKADFSTC